MCDFFLSELKQHRLAILCLVMNYFLTGTVMAEQVISEPDSNLINQLNERSLSLWSSKPDSTIILANQALEISKRKLYKAGEMRALGNLGIGYYEKGDYNKSIKSYNIAIAIADSLNDKSYIARMLSNLSMPYLALGAHNEALKNLYKSLALAEENNQFKTVAHANHNIGMVYHYQSKSEQAIQYYQKSLNIYEAAGDTTRSTFILGNMAHLYLKKKNFEKAKSLYVQSLKLAEKQQNKKGVGNALQSLGAFYLEQGNIKEALSYLFKSKKILHETGEGTEYLRLLDNLVACYLVLGDRTAASNYANENYKLASKQQQFYYMNTAAEQLSKLYEESGDYYAALDYFKKATLASDSLNSRQNKDALVRMEEKYRYQEDQKQAIFMHDMQLKRKNLVIYSAVVLIFVLIVIALLFASNIRQKRRINKILKETNDFFEEQNTILETSNHFKEQLLSLVAHDVRHPIASLQNVLYLFENKHLSSRDIQQLMSSCHHELSKLVLLLDDLLLWVKLQLNYTLLQKIHFQLEDLLHPLLEIYRRKADDKKIQLKIENASDIIISADMEAISTVIRNLVHNAIKFSNLGDTICIYTSPATTNGRIRICVQDTGIGMSEEILENIFTVPSEIRRSGTNHENGSGLGIQICMHYLQLENSKLMVESKQGKGTTFWFEIDLA